MTVEKIRWSDDERKKVSDIVRSFGAPERQDGAEVWAKAMAEMPANRRRPFNNQTQAWMNAERRRGRPPNGKATEAVPTFPPSIASTFSTPPAPAEEPLAPAAPNPLVKFLVDTVLEVLYDTQIRSALRDIVKETMTPEAAGRPDVGVLWPEETTARPRRKRIVLVTGRKGENYKSYLTTISRLYDLRIWGDTGNTQQLREMIKGADVVVAQISGISHKASDIARAWGRADPRHKLILWTKNFPELDTQLPGLLGEEVVTREIAK